MRASFSVMEIIISRAASPLPFEFEHMGKFTLETTREDAEQTSPGKARNYRAKAKLWHSSR